MLPPLVSPAMKEAKPVPPVPIAAGLSVSVLSEAERPARCSRLKDGELFTANLCAKFPGIAPMHPGQVFRKSIGILELDRRQERGTAQRGDVAEGQLRQPANAG